MSWFKKKDPPPEQESKAVGPREPRVHVLPLHGLHCRIEDPPPGREVEISNLSISGAGFIVPDLAVWPPLGERVYGKFILDVGDVLFAAEIVHKTTHLVGVHFVDRLPEVRSMVQSYFEVELKANAMIEVNPEMLKPEADGEPRWFRATNGFELYLVENKAGQVIFTHMTFLGNYLEAGRGKPPRVGTVIDEEPMDKAHYKGSDLVRYQQKFDEHTHSAAMRMVESVSALTPSQRAGILILLDKG